MIPVDLSTRKNLTSLVFSGIKVTQPKIDAAKQATPTPPITQPVTIADRPRITRSAARSITARNFAFFAASLSGFAVHGDTLLIAFTAAVLRNRGGPGPAPSSDRPGEPSAMPCRWCWRRPPASKTQVPAMPSGSLTVSLLSERPTGVVGLQGAPPASHAAPDAAVRAPRAAPDDAARVISFAAPNVAA